MQGLAIDGREVRTIEISAWVRHERIGPGQNARELPVIGITFYDDQRRDMGSGIVGPFRGEAEWRRVKQILRVPPEAREGIFRIGLFGATGEISFDNVKLEKVE